MLWWDFPLVSSLGRRFYLLPSGDVGLCFLTDMDKERGQAMPGFPHLICHLIEIPFREHSVDAFANSAPMGMCSARRLVVALGESHDAAVCEVESIDCVNDVEHGDDSCMLGESKATSWTLLREEQTLCGEVLQDLR